MEKENMLIVTEAIIMAIGSREKWKDKDSYMMSMAICNIKESGKMTILKEEGS